MTVDPSSGPGAAAKRNTGETCAELEGVRAFRASIMSLLVLDTAEAY